MVRKAWDCCETLAVFEISGKGKAGIARILLLLNDLYAVVSHSATEATYKLSIRAL